MFCPLTHWLLRWLDFWGLPELKQSGTSRFSGSDTKRGNTKLLVPWPWCEEVPVLEASHTNHGFIQILGLLPVGVSELTDHWLQGFWVRPVQYEVLQESGKSVNNSAGWTPNETSLRRKSHLAAAKVSATQASLFWVTRTASSTFSSISGFPA